MRRRKLIRTIIAISILLLLVNALLLVFRPDLAASVYRNRIKIIVTGEQKAAHQLGTLGHHLEYRWNLLLCDELYMTPEQFEKVATTTDLLSRIDNDVRILDLSPPAVIDSESKLSANKTKSIHIDRAESVDWIVSAFRGSGTQKIRIPHAVSNARFYSMLHLFSKLEDLALEAEFLTVDQVTQISQISTLRSLKLSLNSTSPAVLESLGNCRRLEHLEIAALNSEIVAADHPIIALPKLQSISLSGIPLSEPAADLLKRRNVALVGRPDVLVLGKGINFSISGLIEVNLNGASDGEKILALGVAGVHLISENGSIKTFYPERVYDVNFDTPRQQFVMLSTTGVTSLARNETTPVLIQEASGVFGPASRIALRNNHAQPIVATTQRGDLYVFKNGSASLYKDFRAAPGAAPIITDDGTKVMCISQGESTVEDSVTILDLTSNQQLRTQLPARGFLITPGSSKDPLLFNSSDEKMTVWIVKFDGTVSEHAHRNLTGKVLSVVCDRNDTEGSGSVLISTLLPSGIRTCRIPVGDIAKGPANDVGLVKLAGRETWRFSTYSIGSKAAIFISVRHQM